jgi:predicted Rossmann fold flavoprotein
MKDTSTHYDVIVIGGGASGMMAAGRAAERGRRVLLLEKNAALGEKLKITGGGRCNITNAQESVHGLLANYGAAAAFLHSSFAQFGVAETFSFFTERGLPLVVQAQQRAFPKTEKAIDVCRVLENYLKKGKVTIQTNAPVTQILGSSGHIEHVVVRKKIYTADSYILATGGVSHPQTGSTGDGFAWLTKLGHTVHPPTPTIVPLAVQKLWIKELAGKTLPGAKITFHVNNKKQFAVAGNILCTHFGLSGPTILNAAGKVADLIHQGAVSATIDLFPKTDLGALDNQLLELFDANKNKILKNIFPQLVPPGTARVILSLATDIDPEVKVHSLLKNQRKQLTHLLKELPVSITGLMGYDRAVIADGGVALKEIDAKTMRSKKYANLFVTGDVLHITRPSGGYSLQLCWTSGFVAGSHA